MKAALETSTASDLAAALARGTVSAEQYAQACLACVDAVEDSVQAFVHLDRADVLAQARALDEQRAQGKPIGPLHGVPVAIKDIFDTADYPTEYGSPLLAGRRPWHDATVVAKLRAAGAVIFGKAVTAEFAFYHPGKTRNPHDPERTPGGSSSGSAAAVAAGMVPLALGAQTNGSVIRPAAYCGVFGAKPSHGLISRAGALMASRALDHVGVFARALEDVALLLDVLAGYDPQDPDTRPVAAPDFRKVTLEPWPLAPRFAYVRTPVWEQADASTRAAFDALAASLGEACVAIDLPPRFAGAWEAHRTIMAADIAHRLGPTIDRGPDQVSQVLRDLVAEGRQLSAARYLAALDQARSLAAGLGELFESCNAIITPATTGVAPKGLHSTGSPVFCSLWTLTGVPALSLPLLQGDDGMPLGVQLVGPMGEDARLLRSALWLLKATAKGRRRAGKAKR